ncbi:MAG: prepilin-type N-terminal cleavage/methylation domain-containing protein [Bacilli bacterium]|nr:prepilin-type N-terminal cleavage/methylation domain-containing protein [Bacilli bacterium]
MKKGYTLIEILAVIAILAVIGAIAYPKIADLIDMSKINAYSAARKNIIESAKLKYLADVNSNVVTEYKVVDLIDEGYISKDTKNPLTNDEYSDQTKVVITKENGNIKYDYVDGNTIYDVVSKKNDSDGIYLDNNEYIYRGENAKNYTSFNGEIYRIIKIDSYRNTYLLKEQGNNEINKNDLKNYINSYYNDNYSEEYKTKISKFDILDYEMYLNSFIGNESFITNNSNIWVNYGLEYKILNNVTNTLEDNDKANVTFVLKLNNTITIINGNGSQLDPYIIGE